MLPSVFWIFFWLDWLLLLIALVLNFKNIRGNGYIRPCSWSLSIKLWLLWELLIRINAYYFHVHFWLSFVLFIIILVSKLRFVFFASLHEKIFNHRLNVFLVHLLELRFTFTYYHILHQKYTFHYINPWIHRNSATSWWKLFDYYKWLDLEIFWISEFSSLVYNVSTVLPWTYVEVSVCLSVISKLRLEFIWIFRSILEFYFECQITKRPRAKFLYRW
jgi:hypothetical protein